MLGGNIVVMDEGRVLQIGATPQVYHNPATMKVAEVFSDPPINYIEASVKGDFACFGENIQIPLTGHLKKLTPGHYNMGIRSNHLFLSRKNSDDAEFRARVELSEINGSETITHINHNNTAFVMLDDGIYPHKIGTEISVFVNPRCIFVYNEEGSLVASPSSGLSQ
jgi:glycerol transport system ATP-binding protein